MKSLALCAAIALAASDPNDAVDVTPPTGGSSLIGTLPRAITSFGAEAVDGWLYVYGGYFGVPHKYSREGQSSDFYRINLLDTRDIEFLPSGDAMQSLTLVAYDDDVLRIGGMRIYNEAGTPTSDMRSIEDVLRFDTETLEWSALPPMPEPRSSHESEIIGDTLYVVGGWVLDGSGRRDGDWHDTYLTLDLADLDTGWQEHEQPFTRRALGVAVHGHHLITVGGMTPDGATNAVHILDTTSGDWAIGPEYPGMGFATSAVTLDGRVITSGMQGRVFSFAPGESTWRQEGTLTFPRFFHQLVADNDRVLAMGGIVGMSPDARVRHIESFPMTRSNEPTVSVMTVPAPGAARNRQAMFLNDGELYFFGGNRSTGQHDFDADMFLDEGWALRLNSLKWRKLSNFPAPRQSMQTALHGADNQHGYAVGGFGHNGETALTQPQALRYDFDLDRWKDADAPDLPRSRTQFGLVEYDGDLWIFGGLDFDDRRPRGEQFEHLLDIQRWNVGVTDAWEDAGVQMTTQRRAFGGDVIDNRYYLISGMADGFELVESCEAFDFDTLEFVPIAQPSTPRLSAEIVALDDKLYVAGGSSPIGEDGKLMSNNSIEMYDPITDTWTTVVDELPFETRHMRMFAHGDRLLIYSGHVDGQTRAMLAFIDVAGAQAD